MIQVSNNMQFANNMQFTNNMQITNSMQFLNSIQTMQFNHAMQYNNCHNRFWQPWLPSTNYHPVFEEARPLNFKCKDVSASSVSGGKWKREKKSRHILAPPPDYATHHAQAKLNSIPEPLPLDMSRKSRGSPPPYTASLASRTTTTNSNTSSNGRASVIISSASSSSSSPPSPGSDQGGSSDPVIDEHFRRSLGADYLNLYKSTSPSPTPCDSALSVDDHFAKALGDTWIKLQEAEHKRCSSRSSDGSDIKPLKRNPTSSSSSTTSTLSPPTSPLTRHPSPGAVPT